MSELLKHIEAKNSLLGIVILLVCEVSLSRLVLLTTVISAAITGSQKKMISQLQKSLKSLKEPKSSDSWLPTLACTPLASANGLDGALIHTFALRGCWDQIQTFSHLGGARRVPGYTYPCTTTSVIFQERFAFALAH